jgi:hypothetical protein
MESAFATEWQFVKEAARYTKKGHQACYLIRTPEEVGTLEKYIMTE